MHLTHLRAALASSSLVLAVSAVAVPATAHDTGMHDNCTEFNKVYPHGVGLISARDRTTSGSRGVTTFRRAPVIYWAAENHNGDLDRDNDRVACEKA